MGGNAVDYGKPKGWSDRQNIKTVSIVEKLKKTGENQNTQTQGVPPPDKILQSESFNPKAGEGVP